MFDISAVDSASNQISAAIEICVNPTVPGVPPNLMVISADQEVALEWDVPAADDGDPFDHYIIHCVIMIQSKSV